MDFNLKTLFIYPTNLLSIISFNIGYKFFPLYVLELSPRQQYIAVKPEHP